MNLSDNDYDINLDNLNILSYMENIDNKLKLIKSKLDNKIIKTNWDKWKKLGNKFELIYCSKNKLNSNRSIANYEPVSRSFFKLIEIINEYKLLNFNTKCNILCLAEGPGGFIEAIKYFRKEINDIIVGITIYPLNNNIPNWNKIKKKFSNKNIHLLYENIFDIENIKKKINFLKINKYFLITSDGGIDYSNNYNNQESESYKIIYCEILIALLYQESKGIFICKIFDIFSNFSKKIIYLLTIFYNEVIIYKPKTSRDANSEKYLICKDFKGISKKNLNLLLLLNSKIPEHNSSYLDIEGINMNTKFLEKLEKFNKIIIKDQIEAIELVIRYIYKNPNKKKYYSIIKNQERLAILWCKDNNIEINKNKLISYKFNPF